MHRTDATDFDPDIGNGNPGFKETPAGNETILSANFANALQEEISKVVEDGGLTLRASGALDAAGNWGQLSQAIQVLIDKKGVIASASAFGLTEVPGSGAVNTLAINTAFSNSNIVYIPSGNYEIDGAPIIPDGGMLIGDNGLSVLTAKSHSSWNLGDKNVSIIGINFDHDGTFSNNIILPHTIEKYTVLENCIFSGSSYTPIFITSNNNGVGLLKVSNCHFNNVNRAIEISSGGSAKPRMIITGNIFTTSIVAHFEGSADGFSIYKNNTFNGCTFFVDDKNTIFEGNEFDGATIWNFNGTNSCIIRNNIFNTTPTVNPSNNPRFFFTNNINRDGKILIAEESIIGALVNYKITGDVVIPASGNQVISWNQKIAEKMSFHDDYTKDDVYNNLSGLFTARGLGNGNTHFTCQILMTQVNDIDVITYLRINGIKSHIFSKSNIGITIGVHSLDINLKLNSGETFDVLVENFTASNAVILKTITGLESFVKVEGF